MSKIYIGMQFESEKNNYINRLKEIVSDCKIEVYQITIPTGLTILAWNKIKQKQKKSITNDLYEYYLILMDIKTGWETRSTLLNDLKLLGDEFFDLAYDFMGYGSDKIDFEYETDLIFENGNPELTLSIPNKSLVNSNIDECRYKFSVKSF